MGRQEHVSQARGVACEIVTPIVCTYYSSLFLLYRSHLDSIMMIEDTGTSDQAYDLLTLIQGE